MSILNSLKVRLFGNDNYQIKRRIAALLKNEAAVIVEAGAHIGSDTLELSKVWPSGTIHAFEPVPPIYERLVRTTKKRKNIITYPVALGDRTGDAEIFVSSGNSDGSSSLLSPKVHIADHPGVLFTDKIAIKTITLDEWAAQNGVTHVDFAWLDMQGLEPAVLKASPLILNTLRVVYTEVNLKEMYEGVALYPEFRQWMAGQGFRVEFEDMPYSDFGNVLFVKD